MPEAYGDSVARFQVGRRALLTIAGPRRSGWSAHSGFATYAIQNTEVMRRQAAALVESMCPWGNLDQVVSATERLGSSSFDEGVVAGWKPTEFYPCVELSTSDGDTHLVTVGGVSRPGLRLRRPHELHAAADRGAGDYRGSDTSSAH